MITLMYRILYISLGIYKNSCEFLSPLAYIKIIKSISYNSQLVHKNCQGREDSHERLDSMKKNENTGIKMRLISSSACVFFLLGSQKQFVHRLPSSLLPVQSYLIEHHNNSAE